MEFINTEVNFLCDPDITVATVRELINKIDLSKSSGCLNISTRIYKDCLNSLSEQLTYLFNLSLKQQRIPLAWKSGLVTPLPKKGDITQPNNIRPITQTHICGKILERIISQRLTNHFEENSLFYPNQMGFRKGHSTTVAISKFISDVNLAQNNNYITGCIYRSMQSIQLFKTQYIN